MSATAAAAARTPRRMNAWRLEWLRLVRTPRALSIAAVFLLFGLIEPVATKYAQQIVSRVGNGAQIKLPAPTPAAAISSYVNNATLIGLVVIVVIAAGAFSFDARRGLAIFLRTRSASIWRLIVPRFVINAAVAAAGYLVGTLGAWYETALLIGRPGAGDMAEGMLCGAVYLAFAVALAGAAASFARSTLGSVGLALAALLALPLVGTVTALHAWLPSTLADAPAQLLSGSQLSGFGRALGVSVAATAALLAIAAARLRRREV